MKFRTRGEFTYPLRRKPVQKSSGFPQFVLVHVTSVGYGREIVQDGQLEARYCKFFKDNLVYFFVDKASYRHNDLDEKSDQINRFPFVLVQQFDPKKIAFHAYPFDTGAAMNGLYEEKADPYVHLQDYEIGNTIEEISLHISWAFESRTDYFEGNLRSMVADTLNPWDSVEKSFLSIAQMATPQHNRPDKRASSVEVAFDYNFGIHKNDTHVVIPKQLIEWGQNRNLRILAELKRRKITWSTYDWLPNRRPSDYYSDINQIIRDRYIAD